MERAHFIDSAAGAAPPQRVFLSYTSELRQHPTDRSFIAAAEAAIIRAGHAVADMAYFTARDTQPAAYCSVKISEAHIFVAVIGHRYGAEVRDRPELSYTELEFEVATRLALPRLVFLVREGAAGLPAADQPDEHRARQRTFRDRLKNAGPTITWVASPAELEILLYQALTELESMLQATARATRTLPRDLATFTGREDESEQVLAAAEEAARLGSAVEVVTIDGMAGVGKTAFAIHAAHQVASLFPDGQVFLDLHGHTAGQRPVAPIDALGALLLTTGVNAQHIPSDLEGRSARWRDRLAGRKMLVLLDDAAGHEQVRPLLPGTTGSLVLITSRHRLAALEGVTRLPLGTLPAAQAAELFSRLTGIDTQETDLVDLCGHLPLAIGLLAGRLRTHPSWTVRHLTDRLQAAHDRLAELHADDLAVGAAFSLSYQDLPPDQRRLFRRLGLHPGRDFDAYATAALEGTDVGHIRRGLDALYAVHLLDEPQAGRYRMHDLIRDYARSLAAHDDTAVSELAVDRLLDYYVETTAAASRHIVLRNDARGPNIVHPAGEAPDLTTRQQALVWLEAERSNVNACLDYAATHARHEHVVNLARVIHPYLRLSGNWDQALASHEAAVAAGRLAGNRYGMAIAFNDMGIIQRLSGRHTAAATSLARALDLYQELDDSRGRANALHELGVVRYTTGEYDDAITSLTQALDLYRELDDRMGHANSFKNLGIVQRLKGQYRTATASLTAALAFYRDVNSRHGQAQALNDLGIVQRLTGDTAAATHTLTQALALYRDLGTPLGQAEALNNLGTLLLQSDPDSAMERHREALRLSRDIPSPLQEAHALEGIGRCLIRALDMDGIAMLTEALTIYQRIGAPEAKRVRALIAEMTAARGPND